jgi:hypothetical protein
VKDLLRYDKMVEAALRSVVRDALTRTAAKGLPEPHHFYITFRTKFAGAALPDYLLAQYPEEMTIVIEHQFWELEVKETEFSVTLRFQNHPERLTVPFEAITAFADPSVKFGLQFQPVTAEGTEAPPQPAAAPRTAKPTIVSAAESAAPKSGEVVTLDTFRKK